MERSNVKPCSVCGLYPTDINGVIRYTCGHSQPLPPNAEDYIDGQVRNELFKEAAKSGFARERRHNYRTAGIPPQSTDKHIDELK